ncbi:MAG: YggS family pyridoxal phosphate-dependent enzyme [Nitrospirae bacterium CG18_big_fil_WC_8_21_14_2_50_70_55]|nr:YggS family pyridoxal phosphate-dependent enzyme [Deltaproteobacteria bacterium]OIP65578.1 MAG: YggS family pyridoxal phosphate enzyme [Nitrospirae bacterium CG2_30_70_394]PIQ04786.1 MAG: YggS family pyridoxal phosphate-dependent enzyme [Nitrospirae bacterium CG18_big_fil_WC_8_21_14_2_50_70_55]PIU78226.1 MAG: YggS family pyridoxal phosphate-dependent enzyme [Nitrospirae bacterium CG06_land_8_20_14_3_00_70_43]PIW82231.1 MAG: YggS family pyridoxal phosphate-dependent enzyme [Nitrospirae bacter
MNPATRVAAVRERIAAACARVGRDPAEVVLIGVSKSQPAAAVQAVVDQGVTILGEARVQEARAKRPHLSGVTELHLIGRLQRNKASAAVALFDLIHSLDRLPLANALAAAAAAAGKRQRCLVQVNVGREPQKGGVLPEALATLWKAVAALPELVVEGIMAVPPYALEAEQARPTFCAAARLARELEQQSGRPLRLSLGMSHDFEVAIEEGAHWLRVGTALFGERG